MEATELRLGNWVNNVHTGEPYQINIEKMIRLLEHFKENVVYVKPIPLTEEWLLKFGFETQLTSLNFGFIVFELNAVAISLDKDGFYFMHNEEYQNIYYVHQLQNLYFALTNKELEIKK
jgi:hypothetical protein